MQNHFVIGFCLFTIFHTVLVVHTEPTGENADRKQNSAKEEPLLTAALYAKLFRERRQEHNLMAKQMLQAPYEKNYKLLSLAYKKIFEVIGEHNATLAAGEYRPASGFPQTDAKQQEAVIMIMENCCIGAELLLHFPEASYRIFRKSHLANWKPILNWCNIFIFGFPHIVDESTAKLLSLLQQEINEELRGESYVNPYYTKVHVERPAGQRSTKPKKPAIKRGPRLSGGGAKIEL